MKANKVEVETRRLVRESDRLINKASRAIAKEHSLTPADRDFLRGVLLNAWWYEPTSTGYAVAHELLTTLEYGDE